MIIRDSEMTIDTCLGSLLGSGCFDQIIIIQDTRTKDRTPDILADYAYRYPQITLGWHEWKRDDYSEARNKTLGYARTEYGYWQDGDEILLDGPGIRNILADPLGAAYHIWQLSPTPDGGIVSTHQLRLFPILTGVKWELPVHEQLAFSIRRLAIPEVMTPYRVSHIGYASEEENIRKHTKYSKIMKTWLLQHRKNDAAREYITELYQSSQEYLRSL